MIRPIGLLLRRRGSMAMFSSHVITSYWAMPSKGTSSRFLAKFTAASPNVPAKSRWSAGRAASTGRPRRDRLGGGVVRAEEIVTEAQLESQLTQESVARSQLSRAVGEFEETRRIRNARQNEEWQRRAHAPVVRAGRLTPLAPTEASSSRTQNNDVERTSQPPRPPVSYKRIGIYDALDEQNRRRREAARLKPERPQRPLPPVVE
jgi:hypothetical protein